MPRSNPTRTTKSNHRAQRARKSLAVVPLPDPDDHTLAHLREKHPDVSDAQARLAIDIALMGLSVQQSCNQHAWPHEWAMATLTKPAVASFVQDLGVLALGPAAIAAQHTMVSLLRARSAYVRYSAAQDLMDRAGLRAAPSRSSAPQAASISINIGVAADTQKPVASLVIEQGTPDDHSSDSETV